MIRFVYAVGIEDVSAKDFTKGHKKSVKLLVLHSNEGPEKTVEQM